MWTGLWLLWSLKYSRSDPMWLMRLHYKGKATSALSVGKLIFGALSPRWEVCEVWDCLHQQMSPSCLGTRPLNEAVLPALWTICHDNTTGRYLTTPHRTEEPPNWALPRFPTQKITIYNKRVIILSWFHTQK